MDAQPDRVPRELAERVKELTALHATARLLNEAATPLETLRRVVALLPPAWQYADIAAARIAFGDFDVRTARFSPTRWRQQATFAAAGAADDEAGVIEVVYVEERPDAAEGPFLAEERHLIESLAGMLSAYFERLHAVDDRIRLARAEASRIEAQQANRAKDEFLAMLFHELRSPLNVMAGWIHMLRTNGVDPSRRAEGLEILERSVRIQTKLIDDLLDLSRVVMGKLYIDPQKLDLGLAANTAVDAVRPAAGAKHIDLRTSIAPSLWVRADPIRLQQVIANLLANALKFTPEDGRIDLTAAPAGGNVSLTVRDTGIGIEPELLPLVFERFRQGDYSTARLHGGLGLGLAIVKHLVERHGGQIAVSSNGQGLGSAFTVTLPRFDEQPERPIVTASLEPFANSTPETSPPVGGRGRTGSWQSDSWPCGPDYARHVTRLSVQRFQARVRTES